MLLCNFCPSEYLFYCMHQGHQANDSVCYLNLEPFTIGDLLVTSPYNVFIEIEVFLPFEQRLVSNFSKIRVPWLQLSSNPYFFTILSDFLYCNLTYWWQLYQCLWMRIWYHHHLIPSSFHCVFVEWSSGSAFFSGLAFGIVGCFPLHSLHAPLHYVPLWCLYVI